MLKAELKQLLDEKLDAVINHLEALPEDHFVMRGTTEKWSNGEHLDHLRKSTRALNKVFKIPSILLRFKFGTSNREERTYEATKEKYKLKVSALNNQVKAPNGFQPDAIDAKDKSRLLSWFRGEKETMKGHIDRLSEKRLSKYVLPHPLLGKMTFRELVYFTAFHAEHHFELMKKYNT